jgi:hypothetical protein
MKPFTQTVSLFLTIGVLIMTTSVLNAKSINTPYYFVTVDQDTTFCYDLSYHLGEGGELYQLSYTDLSGVRVKLSGIKKMPNVVTFYLNGHTFDKVPSDLNSPKPGYAFSERRVDGNLKVYLDQRNAEIERFYVRLGPGEYCNIENSNTIRKYIKPLLESCEDFLAAYNGNIEDEEAILEMISFYNFVCE